MYIWYLSIVIDDVYLHIVWSSPSASLSIIVYVFYKSTISDKQYTTLFLVDQNSVHLLAQLHHDQGWEGWKHSRDV